MRKAPVRHQQLHHNAGKLRGLPVKRGHFLGWGYALKRPGPWGGFLGKRYDPLCGECQPAIDPKLPQGPAAMWLGTPRVSAQAGRDHWTFCYSVLLAGAGIRGGTLCGASDAQTAYVKDRPVRPADICATIYHCLGIDPEMPVYDRSGRPVPIAHGGQPIREILS